MFDGLFQGPTHTVPWPWMQTDNVIQQYEELKPLFDKLSTIDENSNFNDNKAFLKNNTILDTKLTSWLNKADAWLNDNIPQLLKHWPHARAFAKYKGEVQITRQAPAPYRFPVHDESYDKCWSGVIYVAPNEGTGTNMYTGVKGNNVQNPETITLANLWGSAPWKPNRAFVFAGIQSKTWHDYGGIIDAHRITVNLFIKNKRN